MFGDQSAAGAVGRFRVLQRLGAGGMGVVYEAYDPELARGVALKLVNVAAKDRKIALDEAQALARLSHPNVVPIYDVGFERNRVYLVMELVRGKTLRQWVPGRKPREILDVYQQAGRALAAAHDAGLVHRDFKPENAIVGADGRVRVVDFGLACEADDPERMTGERRHVAGTPRFMAPEIKAGSAVTPAADQYSFCVALAGALERTREPTPRRIVAVIERGRAADPAERFRSMNDLLRALARDPARTRGRLAAVGGLVVTVGVLAFFLGRHNLSEAPDVCDEGAAQLEAAWSQTARSAALARVATLGAYGQSLRPLLERGLEAHVSRWVSEYGAACRDRRSGVETDTMADRRTTCLRRGSDALAAVGELIRRAEPAKLAELPLAVQSMPDPASCSDRDALTADIARPPPGLKAPVESVQRQITQARIQVGAGRYEQAIAEARTAVANARRLNYEPVLAEALLVQGHAQMNLVDREAAVPVLAEATKVAMSSRADALAVEAWARRAYVQGNETGPDGALAGVDLIESLAQRTTSAAFARALLYNNIGSVELAREQRTKAREAFARALTESENGPARSALELVVIRANLGLATDDRAQGDRLVAEAASELTDRLGADHPETLEIQRLRGFATIENLREAENLLSIVCRAYEVKATFEDRTARCWTEVGLVRWELGDPARALEALERAASTPSQALEDVPYISLLKGDAGAAVRQFAAALAANAPNANEHWWDRQSRARLFLGLGRARRQMGDLRGARDALEHAVADLDPIVRVHPSTSQERRLGRARVELALTLFAIGAHSPEGAIVTTAAVAWLRRVGGAPAELARLEGLRIP
jgi:tetratricopeptide (TPR) repeat protein/predicted Ser/Thr protein kinase